MFLDRKLDFYEHIKGIFDKTSKSISFIRKLISSANLEILFRSHVDYGDIIYEAFVGSFEQKLQSIWYDVALAVAGAIRDTSRNKIYSALGLESM